MADVVRIPEWRDAFREWRARTNFFSGVFLIEGSDNKLSIDDIEGLKLAILETYLVAEEKVNTPYMFQTCYSEVVRGQALYKLPWHKDVDENHLLRYGNRMGILTNRESNGYEIFSSVNIHPIVTTVSAQLFFYYCSTDYTDEDLVDQGLVISSV